MRAQRLAATAALVLLATVPLVSTQASAHPSPKDVKSPPATFYANAAHNHMVAVTFSDGKATAKTLLTATSPVWWRDFYLTPTSTAGPWVVGTLSGGQYDTNDPPRLYAFNTVTRRFSWITPSSWTYRLPIVNAEKVPELFYVSGKTVREKSTAAVTTHRVFSAPDGWSITAMSVAGTSAPYVALTSNTALGLAAESTYVVHLTSKPTVVMPVTKGSVTALALSRDMRTLAISRIMRDGVSVLALQSVSHGGLTKTLPYVGQTTQLSWDAADDTLAVDPEQWGGVVLLDVFTGAMTYPLWMQPYGGGIFAS